MRRFASVRPSFVATVAIVALVSSAVPALAASTLNTVQVNSQQNGDAIVSVSFSGGIPPYHVVGAGTSETAVIFDSTTLGPQAPPSVAGSGPISSLSIASTGTSASVALHLSGAPAVRVRTGGTIVFINVAGTGAPTAGFGAVTAATTPAGLGPVNEIVFLKYADISEVAGILVASSSIATNDTFTPQQTNIGSNSLGNIGGQSSGFNTPAVQQTFGSFGQQTSGLAQRVNDNIAVDRRLNAIMLSGTADVVAGLKAIIDKIDVAVPSVMLETQIVELSDTAARNIGLDFSPDGTGIVVNAIRSTTSTTTGNTGITTQTGQMGQAGATLQAALYAQVSEGNGRVIAKPRILAQSGQQASILTGDALPISTSTIVANAGVANTVNYINVGVNLQIQPRVSSDGFVTSHIYSEVSSVTGFTNGNPTISQRTASTSATVRDGDSFIIGGLLQDNELRTLSKLPFLGDLPLIGPFFQHLSTSHSQTNLYIVVTPHVVGPSGVTPAVSPLVVPSALPQLGPPPPPANPAPSAPPLTGPKLPATPVPGATAKSK
jgi:general secretion pathway protein D